MERKTPIADRRVRSVRSVLLVVACLLAAGSCRTASNGGRLPDPHATSVAFVPRADYDMPLEPAGTVLHGAGQSRDAFRNYVTALGAGRRPIIYKTYIGFEYPLDVFFNDLKSACDYFKTVYDVYLIPEIGLSMTEDGNPSAHYEDDVAAGLYDDRIEEFCRRLGLLGHPVFVRIGFECNGSWNGYAPATYRQAFARITDALRDPGRNLEAATVWCVAHPLNGTTYRDWYPGDQYVDWWSIDLFSASELSSADTHAFLDDANIHARPVMIAETTPRYVGVTDGQSDWDAWFEPFFALIQSRPGIKAFCYIDWNWADYPQWSDWGDARLEQNPQVLSNYRFKTTSSLYLHGTGEQAVRRALGTDDTIPPAPPTGLAASFVDHTVELSWSAPAGEPAIVRYDIFRGATNMGSAAGLAFTDDNLSSGATNAYTVRAVDAGGNTGAASDPATAVIPDPLAKIGNREFDNGAEYWRSDAWQGGAASFTIDNGGVLSGANAARLAVTGTGTAWHVQLRQAFTTHPGKTYRLRFDARADDTAPVTVMLQQSHEPYGGILSRDITLTSSPQSFDFSNSGTPLEDTLYVTFMLGRANGRIVWIDNVRLEESD